MNWRKFNFRRGLFLDKCNIDQELSIQFDFILGRDDLSLYRLYNILEEKKERKGMDQHLSSSVKTYQKNRERYLIHK